MSKSASAGLCGQNGLVHEKHSNYLGDLMFKSTQFIDVVLLCGLQTGCGILM